MEDSLTKYGLLAVLFGAMIEADAMPVMSGAVAHLGYFEVLPAAVLCLSGMFAGDCAWYWFGRLFGNRFSHTSFYMRMMPKAEHFADKFGVWQIFAARFILGLRTATMLFWGCKKLDFMQFAAIDLLGCGVWGILLVGAGYFLSASMNAILGEIKQTEILVLAMAIGAAGILVLIKKFGKRKYACQR